MQATRIMRQAIGWVAAGTISLALTLAATGATAASPGPVPQFDDLDGPGRVVDPPALRLAPAAGASHGPDSYLQGKIGFTSITK